MKGYESIRDDVRQDGSRWLHLDVVQLFKHALGLRTQVCKNALHQPKRPILFYLYAEPKAWPNGTPVESAKIQRRREEIVQFSTIVAEDEVKFRSCSYCELLNEWGVHPNEAIRRHAAAVIAFFKSNV